MNILINIDIIILEKINILTFKSKINIESYNILILVKIRIKIDHIITYLVYFKNFLLYLYILKYKSLFIVSLFRIITLSLN